MNGERKSKAALLAVIICAFALRGLGVFDAALPYSFYGDEISNVEHSVNFYDGKGGFDLNPRWFNKPALGYYINFFVFGCRYLVGRHVTGEYASAGAFADAFLNFDRGSFYILGRLLQAFYGCLGVYLVWRIGKRFGGARVGLLAAIILAVCPGHVSYSQTVKNDALAAVFVSAAFLAALNIAERGRLRDHAWAAIWIGLGWATKYTPAAMLGVVALAHLLRPREVGSWPISARAVIVVVVAFLGAAFAGSPYNFLDPTYFRENLKPVLDHFGRMVFGAGEVESGRYSLIYLLRYAFWMTGRQYAFTMPLTVCAFIGLIFGSRGRGKHRVLLLISWLVLFYFMLASANLQRTRVNHLMVIYPALAVAAALGLDYVTGLFSRRFGLDPARVLAVALLLLIAPWPGSPGGGLVLRARELLTPPPQLVAMEWVWKNIPADSTVVNDGEVLTLKPNPARYGWIRRRIAGSIEKSRRALATERARSTKDPAYDRKVSRRIINHFENQLVIWGRQEKRFAYEAPAAKTYAHPRYDLIALGKPWQSERGDTIAPFFGYNPLWEVFPLPDVDARQLRIKGLDDLAPVERYRRSPDTLPTLTKDQLGLHPLLPDRPVDFWISSQESFDNYDKQKKRDEFREWAEFYDDLRAHYDAVEFPGDDSLDRWAIRVYDLRYRKERGELREADPRVK